MITTRPYRASSLQNPIGRASRPNGHARHASAERLLVVGLHDEVHMVVLHGEVHEAKPGARRLRESAANRRENRLPAQTRQASYDAQSHVDGLPSMVRRALVVIRAGPAARAARSLAFPAQPLGNDNFPWRERIVLERAL
jgi:hypothetical protein